ncbi:unnamed protein product [Ambrosiozyma monospora]|uniref:Unnamed protein product n=1 Tax=Ambrosiozyma monospora TaxID=43982 RepID=A0A9W6T483_AMBMO|nr:unnamed protein product [Ambrosiozyma monospora]
MFAARFDPLALVQQQQQSPSSDEDENSNSDVNDEVMKSGDDSDEENGENDKKRKRDDDSDSDDSDSDSDSDEEEDDDEKKSGDDAMDVDEDVSKEDQNEEIEENEEDKDEPRPEVSKDDEYIQSHSSVFKRFQKTMNLQTKIQESGYSVDSDKSTSASQLESEPTELKDIAPLPQPALPKDKSLHAQTQKNKTLNWLAEPTYHKTTLTKPFSDADLID